MGFNLIYWNLKYAVNTFLMVLFWKNVENFGKLPFFRADMAGLGIYDMGGYGRIGVYRVMEPVQTDPLTFAVVLNTSPRPIMWL